MKNMRVGKIRNRLGVSCLQTFLIFCWMNILLETDSYYSVYILCGMFGVAGMALCYKNQWPLCKMEAIVIAGASVVFSLAVILANYSIFLPVRSSMLEILAAFAGGIAVAWNILVCLCKKVPFRQVVQREPNLKKQTAVFLLSFAVFATINLLYLFFVAYPGFLTPDSLFQVGEILNGYTSNHHPFWHTIVISVFLNSGLDMFGNINAAVATYSVASVLFMAACFSYAIATLYCAGASKRALIICGLIYALAPYHIAYSVTMWKDVAFSGVVLLFVTALFRIVKKIGHLSLNLICLFLSGVAISIWRSNGWLALIAFVLFFGIYCLLRKKKLVKTIIVLCAAILVAWFMRSPVLSMLNITQPDFVESLSVPVQQVARVISENRELSEEEHSLLSQIMDIEEVPELYKPYISDPIKHEIRTKNQDHLIENKGTYLKLWIQLGLKYPGDYIKAWVDQTRGYYNGGYSYWICASEVSKNSYSITSDVEPNGIQEVFQKYFDCFSTSPLMEPVKSIGLHVWILCALFIVCLIQKRAEVVLCVPPLMIIATLLVATPVFSEFRYAYCIFTTLPFLAVVCLNSFKDKEGTE